MSKLFGGGSTPTPQPVPVAPVDNSAAQAEQDNAARQAQADAAAAGRRSTIVGGQLMADQTQRDAGAALLAQKKKAASTDLMGL
mgnify:CR=1 FL=1